MRITRPVRHFVAAVHTPFHPDGSIAPVVVATQAAFLAANGIHTVFVTGSTGEAHSLTREERQVFFDAWMDAAPALGIDVMAHVGSNSIEDARALARHAAGLGVSAISALAPSYFKPATVGALVDWCAAIAAEAPEVPYYYYDIPSMTGVSLPVDAFLKAAAPRIPNLAGVKFTNLDLVAYRRALDVEGGRFDLPWGTDEALLGGLATGALGAVGSTYNWAPGLYQQIRDAFDRGDLKEARRLQSISISMIDAIAATGFMGTAKALMVRLGVPVGPARPPFDNPSSADVDRLFGQLKALGFDTWGARPLEA